MDEWERGMNGICYGLCDPVGPFTVISFGRNDEQYPGFSFVNNENVAQDSQILEKKMILERKIDGVPIRKLFVSNIDKHARNNHVYNIFKEFGEIVNVHIRKQHVSERYRDTTYGFVTFKSTEAAARALSCTQPLVMNNRLLTCNPADSWHQPIVNPDGTVEFGASFLYDKNNKNNETEKDEKDSNDVLDEDDIAGAVGGLVVSTVSSQEAESCPISRLNDDCLWHIFSKLPIDEQIIVGKVCRRWNSVVLSMCRKIEYLNFKEHFSKRPIQMDVLQSLLEYIGPNLKVLNCDLGDGFMYINKSFVSIVARYCRNLEVLDITNVNIASRSFQFLAKQCTKLRSVSFTSCIQLTDFELMNLFGNHNINLESITLKKASELRGKCFTSLKPSVKYLSIDMCNNIKPELLMLGLQKVNNSLVDLKLKNCMAKWGYSFERIAEILPNLNKFTVTDIYPLGAGGSSSLMPLGLLAELEYLDLSNNFLLCDVSLMHLVNSCKKLKTLILVGQQNHDNGVTRAGIIELNKLENLEELNISCQEGVDDEGFKLLALKISQKNRIKKLVCFNCINLGDKGVSCILSSCPELELLDLSECSSITNETIDNALAVVKKRDNNVVLTLMLYGTNVSIKDESSYQHPLLKLDFTDTTSMHHINLFNQFILECGEDHCFHGRLNCQCCIALGDEDDLSHDADDIEDLFFDIDELDFDSDEIDYESDYFGEAQNFS